jgi:hypothetical protein
VADEVLREPVEVIVDLAGVVGTDPFAEIGERH